MLYLSLLALVVNPSKNLRNCYLNLLHNGPHVIHHLHDITWPARLFIIQVKGVNYSNNFPQAHVSTAAGQVQMPKLSGILTTWSLLSLALQKVGRKCCKFSVNLPNDSYYRCILFQGLNELHGNATKKHTSELPDTALSLTTEINMDPIMLTNQPCFWLQ